MKNFKKKYNDYFYHLHIDEKQSKKMMENINNHDRILSSQSRKKFIPVMISVVLCLTFIGIVYGKDIIKKVYEITNISKEDGSIGHTCRIGNNNLDNFNNEEYKKHSDKEKYTSEELSKITNAHILSNPIYSENEYTLERKKEIDNNLAYALFNSKKINAKEIYKEAWDNSSITLSFSFFTKYATDEMKENKSAFDHENKNETYNMFEIGNNCSDKNFDIYHIESLNTDLYIYKIMEDLSFMYNGWNEKDKTELNIFAFFEYDNIVYLIHGEFVNRDMIKDFAELLK